MAAWQLYVELLTRIAPRSLNKEYSDEKVELETINSILDITRQILRTHSRDSMEFAKIAILVAATLWATGGAGGALRKPDGGAEDFLMRDRRLTSSTRGNDTSPCGVEFPILFSRIYILNEQIS